jgi:hypothetical protein
MDTLPKMMEELHDSDEGKGNNLSQYTFWTFPILF